MYTSTLKHSRDDYLPPITAERYLQVFTHKSLRRPGVPIHEMDDNERLTVLGAKALEMGTLDALMGERPLLTVYELETRLQDVLSFENIDTWVKKYSMRDKLRCDPKYFNSLTSREETLDLFHAYVGAVFVEKGISGVKQWIESLLGMESSSSRKIKTLPTMSPQAKLIASKSTPSLPTVPSFQQKPFMLHNPPPPPPPAPVQPMAVPPPPPPPPSMFQQKWPPYTQASSSFGSLYQRQPPFHASYHPAPILAHHVFSPPPPIIKQPPTPATTTRHVLPPPPYQAKLSPPPNPMAPAQPGLAFLPLFNQTAAQRKVQVEYQAEFSGPSHAGRWTVKCVVNGIQKGTGSGGNKQIAKEEAARAAYYSMGWS